MTTIRTLLLAVIIGLAATPASGQSETRSRKALTRALDAELAGEAMQNAGWAVYVADAKSGEVWYRHQADKSYIPASNTKLYSTAAVLDQLGSEWTYRTDLVSFGNVVDGVLEGSLVVRGSGDPAIGGRFNDGDLTEVMRQWADSLKAIGIHTIQGDIVGDDDLFDDTPLGYGWSWDDEPFWYSAEISALSFNDNNVDIALEGTIIGAPATLSWEPVQTGYVSFHNGSITTSSDQRIDEGYARMRGENLIEITSRVPEGGIERESLTISNPTRFFVHVLREVLMQEGIAVTGHAVDIDDLSFKPDYQQASHVARHTSVRMAEIVSVVNKRSQNLYAEQILKTLGAVRPDTSSDATPGSAAMGWASAMRTLAAAAVDTSRIQLVDGSGLSRMNLVTAEMTGNLLHYMWNHPDDSTRAAFVRSLPIGGVDGSLSGRFSDGLARGNVRAKTGTVSNASALSGYVATAAGRNLIFAIMANHFTTPTSQARAVQDRLVETLARHKR